MLVCYFLLPLFARREGLARSERERETEGGGEDKNETRGRAHITCVHAKHSGLSGVKVTPNCEMLVALMTSGLAGDAQVEVRGSHSNWLRLWLSVQPFSGHDYRVLVLDFNWERERNCGRVRVWVWLVGSQNFSFSLLLLPLSISCMTQANH